MIKNYRILPVIFLMTILVLATKPVNASEPAYVVKKIGTSGTDPGEFDAPLDILYAFNQYYVVEQFNNRIQIFDENWSYIDQFGGSGSGSGQFSFPFAIDSNGTHLFVADLNNDRISVHNSDGGYLTEFGVSGTNAGELDQPTSVSIYEDRIYVAEANNQRIQVFNESTFSSIGFIGDTGSGYSLLESPRDMVFIDNTMYVVDMLNDTIKSYDITNGAFRGYFGDNDALTGTFSPYGLNYIKDHFLVTSSDSIFIFDNNGKFIDEDQPSFDNAASLYTSNQYTYIAVAGSDVISQLQIVADPEDVTAKQGVSGISLNWDINYKLGFTNPESYRIYRDDGTGFELIGETDTKYFLDLAVEQNQSYTYQVEAVSIIGNSARKSSNSVDLADSAPFLETVTETITQDQNNSDSEDGIFSSLNINILTFVPLLLLVPILRKMRD